MSDEARIEIDWIGGNCPVQAEGRIDGRGFYFRARGESWSLELAEEGEPVDYEGSAWSHEEEWGDGPYAAGWMPEKTAREMIAKAAQLWRA